MKIKAKPENQAQKMCQKLQSEGLLSKSVRTFDNYRQCLTVEARWLAEHRGTNLKNASLADHQAFLRARCHEVGQKTVEMYRLAAQAVCQHRDLISRDDHLPKFQSDKPQELHSRAFTQNQLLAIFDKLSAENRLSAEIALNAGLRAHELFTIDRVSSQPASERPLKTSVQLYANEKFSGRENTIAYTVSGKGGLVREIRLDRNLAEQLEKHRLDNPRDVVDRTVRYKSHYDLPGGQSWSRSMSRAINSIFGKNSGLGAHGLRHTFAQERMSALKSTGHSYNESLAIVSMELGHFRPEITLAYLR